MGEKQNREEPYLRAVEKARQHHDGQGEVVACYWLDYRLYTSGHLDHGGSCVPHAIEISQASGDATTRAWGLLLEARHLTYLDQDLERANRLYRLAQRTRPESSGDVTLAEESLTGLASTSVELGRFVEARTAYGTLVGVAQRSHDRAREAWARYGLARVHVEEMSELPSAEKSETAKELARQARDVAVSARDHSTEATAELLLGMLSSGEEAREHLDRCLAAAADQGDRTASYCRDGLVRLLSRKDPRAAQRAVNEALALARRTHDQLAIATARREQMRLSWVLASPAKAFADARSALEEIETLRNSQPETDGQASLFSTWAEDYYWLAGRLLEAHQAGIQPEGLARAFWVMERLHGRGLLDALQGVSASTADLARVQASLAADQAILSFVVAPSKDWTGDFGGGSWLLVVTRRSARSYPLAADRGRLRAHTRLFLGAFKARDGSEAQPAVERYRELFGRALEDLPPGVSRLVIIPDDCLHQIPFATLRPALHAESLGARYQISLVPSATLWLHWKGQRAAAAAVPALVLADPAPPSDGDDGELRGAPVERGGNALDPSLPPLLRSREEGKDVVAALGGGSILRVGNDASLQYLREADIGRFSILHFATHAIVDERHPERSAIVLASPAGLDSGRLLASEIEKLRLDGKIVVLSSCRTASGTVLRGEGVMSLARAFFHAGARTVVGSLWPVRDSEARALFGPFYRYLGQGLSVSAALQAAQRDRFAHGPAAAWAGLVVLGDGDLVPLPRGRRSRLVRPGGVALPRSVALSSTR